VHSLSGIAVSPHNTQQHTPHARRENLQFKCHEFLNLFTHVRGVYSLAEVSVLISVPRPFQ